MSENASANELTSQYTAQVTADLERNTKEQDRVSAEIAALQEQLAALERDHAVLVSIQQALDAAPAPAVQPAESVTVPAPREKSTAASGARKGAKSKKTAAQSSRPAGKPAARKSTAKAPAKTAATTTARTASKSTAKTAAAKTTAAKTPAPKTADKATAKAADKTTEAASAAQPTLVDLVRRHLAEQNEPRSAAEVAASLGQTHPDRNVKTTVVRTTLEGLVAKAHAQRSKQGSSVFYTAADASEPAVPAQADKESVPADA